MQGLLISPSSFSIAPLLLIKQTCNIVSYITESGCNNLQSPFFFGLEINSQSFFFVHHTFLIFVFVFLKDIYIYKKLLTLTHYSVQIPL